MDKQSKNKLVLSSLVTVSAMLAASSTVYAQSSRAASADEISNEIIVTAQKRSESLQKIPIAISALSSDDLRNRGVGDYRALAQQVPSLFYGEHDGATFISIRGVGTSVDNGLSEPSVATYIDGVVIPRSTMGNLQQDDLERVEVLRGPQGTLYGRNSTGGAVNFISRKPTQDLTAGFTLMTGGYNRYGATGYISSALNQSISARISGGFEKRDGYVKNVYNGQDIANINRWHVRGAIRFEPNSDFHDDLSVQYLHDNGNTAFQQQLTSFLSPIFPTGTIVESRPWKTSADLPVRTRARTLLISNIAELRASDAITLRSTTGYIDHKISSTFDGEATNYPLIEVRNWIRPSKSFSQEIDAFGTVGKLDWLVGGYYFHENFFSDIPVPFPTGLPGLLPPGAVSDETLHETTNTYAAFANLTYSLTDRLRILGGIRYNRETKDFVQSVGVFLPTFIGIQGLRSGQSTSKLLPKIGLQYDFSNDVTSYVQFQRGFKSGGRNTSIPSFFLPEGLDAYEAGLKITMAGGAATLNTAAFHYQYNNLQILKILRAATVLVENGDARVNGLEAELQVRPVSNLRINAAASYLDAKYTRFTSQNPAQPELGVQNLKGKRLNRSPKFSLTAGVEPSIPIHSGMIGELAFRGEIFYSSTQYYQAYNTPGDRQGAFAKINLSARLESEDKRYTLRAFVNNLTNKKIKSHIIYTEISSYLGNYEPPRMWGLELSAKY